MTLHTDHGDTDEVQYQFLVFSEIKLFGAQAIISERNLRHYPNGNKSCYFKRAMSLKRVNILKFSRNWFSHSFSCGTYDKFSRLNLTLGTFTDIFALSNESFNP